MSCNNNLSQHNDSESTLSENSSRSIEASLALISDMDNSGANTLNNLQQQRETLLRIKNNTSAMKDKMQRTNTLVRNIENNNSLTSGCAIL